MEAPALTENIKKVPKAVWIIGAIVIVAWIALRRASGGGGATQPGVTGGAGGGQGEQPAIASTDLDTFLADQAQNQADFIQAIGDAINGGTGGASGSSSTPAPGGGFPTTYIGPPTRTGTAPLPTTGGTTGGTTPAPTPAPSPVRRIIGYTLRITQSTALYSSTGKLLGHISSGTYTTNRINVGGKWRYVITSGSRKGEYFLAQPYFRTTPIYNTPLPVAPAPAPSQPVSSSSGSLQTLPRPTTRTISSTSVR